VRNATGRADGISRLEARLTSRGWTLAPSPGVEMGVLATTKVEYPPSASKVAAGLARTLEFPVRLESCATCSQVVLLVGVNALAQNAQASVAQSQRG
jgi:hypothetical protein